MPLTMTEIEGLQKKIHDMQEVLKKQNEEKGNEKGVVNMDVISKEEFSKHKDDVINTIENLQKKIDDEEKFKRVIQKVFEEKYKFEDIVYKRTKLHDNINSDTPLLSQFMLKAKYNDPSVLKTAMSEGTAAQGGYTVPQEWADFVAGELNTTSTVVPKCTPFEHRVGYIKNIPKWLTDLTVYWVDEESEKTVSKPTLTSKTSTLKKLCALIYGSDEYYADNTVQMDKLLAMLVAENIAVELERIILVGSTVGGDPFNGIYYSTPSTVTQAAANLQYTDVLNIWNNPNVNEKYRAGAEWYMNRTTLALIMNLVDGNSRPLWSLNNAFDSPFGSILGSRLNISSSIPNTMGTGSVCSTIIYGNYRNVFVGYKSGSEGIQLLVNPYGMITSGTTTNVANLYQQDLTAYRFVIRRAITVVNPLAFSVGVDIT